MCEDAPYRFGDKVHVNPALIQLLRTTNTNRIEITPRRSGKTNALIKNLEKMRDEEVETRNQAADRAFILTQAINRLKYP